MAASKHDKDEYGARETTRRMNAALKRALETPPTPHKAGPQHRKPAKAKTKWKPGKSS
jgi:hypothetical protein